MNTVLFLGFGGWIVTKNEKLFYASEVGVEYKQAKTLADIEILAKKDNKSIWRAILDKPLYGEVYERKRGKWVLVEENKGFA